MSEIITNKLTGKTAAGNVTITSEGGSATMQLQAGVAKHFIVYDETQTIDNSLNNSSITDIGTGNHKFAFTNNFSAAKSYNSGGHLAWTTDQIGTYAYVMQAVNESDVLTGSLEVSCTYVGASAASVNDFYYSSSASHGDLA